MNPLGAVILGFGAWCHRYADHIQLYLSIPSELGEAEKVLDSMGGQKMKLNPVEMEVLLVGSSHVWKLGVQPILGRVASEFQAATGVLMSCLSWTTSYSCSWSRIGWSQLSTLWQPPTFMSCHSSQALFVASYRIIELEGTPRVF